MASSNSDVEDEFDPPHPSPRLANVSNNDLEGGTKNLSELLDRIHAITTATDLINDKNNGSHMIQLSNDSIQ